jgi:hypothetical protein
MSDPLDEPTEDPDPAEYPRRTAEEILAMLQGTLKQQAIRGTKLKNYGAAVAEWLHDYSEGKQKIRSRFEHGISNASDETLTKASAIIEAIAAAVESNDPAGFEAVDAIYERHFAFEHEYQRFQRARALVAGAAEAYQSVGVESETEDASAFSSHCVTPLDEPAKEDEAAKLRRLESERLYHADFLVMLLAANDERFRKLETNFVAQLLGRVRKGGGRSRIGAIDALAQLCLECGAFGVSRRQSKKAVKKRIEDALSHDPSQKQPQ